MHAADRMPGDDVCATIAGMAQAALGFTARDRAEAIIRKWIAPQAIEAAGEDRQLAMLADATLLSADLLLSQPSASGATAFDRLARSIGKPSATEAKALRALQAARFRLLQMEGNGQGDEVAVRDAMTGQVLRLLGAEMPPLADGTPLFGRVAMLGDDVGARAGMLTPLDDEGFAVASAHATAGKPGAAAGVRWAEAMYAHVVRNGTLDVPGLNRPRAGFDDVFDDDSEVVGLALDWAALDGAAPDAGLLQRTRELASLADMLDAFVGAELARESGQAPMAAAFERMLLVQLETVQRRARSGSGSLTPEAVGQAVEAAIAQGRLPERARALFATLRRQAGTGAGQADDPGLERLVQRIRALRAKTVAQGCTEQEALAAAEKVAELLDRHGLSLGELEFRAQPCEGIAVETGRRRFAPIDNCVPAIATYFDCRVWAEQPKGGVLRYVFFGLRGDVAAAEYLYVLVEQAFETETNRFRAGRLYAEAAGERRTASNSFQTGLARGISGKLAALQAARRQGGSGRDLVPVKAAMVEEEMAKLGLDLRQRQGAARKRVLGDAYAAGEAAGQRFEVTPAITAAA